MRLLNTHTRLIEEFLDEDSIPPYGILSYTWGEEEVPFGEMCDLTNIDTHRKEGYRKIDMACQVAAANGYEYIWIDTCCINKSSSAELTEAINSMFSWYKRAKECLVYFYDLTITPLSPGDAVHPPFKSRMDLAKCKWFHRGWTLQELIAPRNITFFDKDWKEVGSKQTLLQELSEITTISEAIPQHKQDLSTLSVAQKMSWAARRETTRIEDTAYCLRGIFGVHLPFISGEKGRAFRRLQEAIITSGSDLNIFPWRRPVTTPAPDTHPTTNRQLRECMFCALGWGSVPPKPGDTGDLQCAVLDYREYTAAFSEFRFDARGWDFHRVYFLERLVFHEMPRRSFIVVEVNRADTGRSEWVRVRFETSRVRDEDVCRSEYWRVEFFLDRSDDRGTFEAVTGEGGLGWELMSN